MPQSQLKKLKANLHAQRTTNGRIQKSIVQTPKRPETTAQRADRLRRETLLPELQRRNKTGGIVDRRIGENDATLAPEDRDLQRYAAMSSRAKKANVFNLEEEDDGGEEQLTHLGQSVVKSERGGRMIDDYAESHDGGSADEEEGGDMFKRSKRRLEDAVDEITKAQEDLEGQPERKKSKKEVMEEVIAKSKLHRYERQKANEEDEDIREALDKTTSDMLALLRGDKSKEKLNAKVTMGQPTNGASSVHPDRAGLLNEATQDASREYDQRLRQLASDKRAQPTQRTKTDEEKAEEDALRLKELEESRQRRMRGEVDINDSEAEAEAGAGDKDPINEDEGGSEDDAADFGFQNASASTTAIPKDDLEVEDEDDFIIDDDLVGSASDADSESQASSDNDESADQPGEILDDADADFLRDVLPATDQERALPSPPDTISSGSSLAYTYPCPQTHTELLQVFKNISLSDIPIVVQRIRALYHSSLAAENKTKLPAFAASLVDHIAFLPTQKPAEDPRPVIESLIRHIHSMSRAYPSPIATAFRTHLERVHAAMSADPTFLLHAGDLTILTAIGTIYPTSDHFHQVVTPAITLIARWLGTVVSSTKFKTITTTTSVKGAYLVALCIRYQRLSRRYIPETLRFTQQALRARAQPAIQHIANTLALANLWKDTSAFMEIFQPVMPVLNHYAKTATTTKGGPIYAAASSAIRELNTLLASARRARRPLELHHHRPLPIKTALPLFESSFNPAKHYDPDPERASASKLRKEHKREKKGAMRELRRDAEFVGREKLKEKKERDRAYEDKFRRIVGGIQREEGEGKKAYDRIREKRKKRF